MAVNVRVRDLLNNLLELLQENEGVEFLEFSISNEQFVDGELIPSSLIVDAYHGDGSTSEVFELEDFEVDVFYKYKEEYKRLMHLKDICFNRELGECDDSEYWESIHEEIAYLESEFFGD